MAHPSPTRENVCPKLAQWLLRRVYTRCAFVRGGQSCRPVLGDPWVTHTLVSSRSDKHTWGVVALVGAQSSGRWGLGLRLVCVRAVQPSLNYHHIFRWQQAACCRAARK